MMTPLSRPARTGQVRVDAAAFIRAVNNVAMFASADDTLPSICCLHFMAGPDGSLRTEATDRYVAAWEHLPADGSPVPDFLVEAKTMTRFAKALQAARWPADKYTGTAQVIVAYDEPAGQATFTLTNYPGLDLALPTESVMNPRESYPQIGRWVSDQAPPAAVAVVQPHMLARLAKVAGPGQMIRLEFREGQKPYTVTLPGGSFSCEAMPVGKVSTAGQAAIEIAAKYGGIDGGHHKWVIDQMLRALTGSPAAGEGSPAYRDITGPGWDEGIAP